MKHQDRTLRIIGGKWRGRKITFLPDSSLRPTGDRIRETLFNWLMHDIRGANCLDLFAGSGILSMEALSRGAAHVTLIENNPESSSRIQHNLDALGTEPSQIKNVRTDAISWLSTCTDAFDIVFLDPPFSGGLLPSILKQLATRPIAGKFVYIESPEALLAKDLPDHWRLHRQKRAAAVHFSLCITG